MPDDFDIVSDLNDGTADTVAAPGNTVSTGGKDAIQVNETREPVTQPKKVGQSEPDAASKPLSLRDQISSAVKGTTEATPPVAQQDGGPARNPDGTFATKPAAGTEVPPSTAAPGTVAAPQGIDPQVFASLPAETQAQLARTMEDVNARQQQLAPLEAVDRMIGERRQAWAIHGTSPEQALGQLFALSDFAGRDPQGFIKYIAQVNKVDLAELVLGMEPAEPKDPAVEALEKEIAELKGFKDTQTRQQQEAAHSERVNNVLAFASEKDQSGNLLRPYFNDLGSEVLPFITMVKQANPTWSHEQVLQAAYERAVWAVPAVREKMQAASAAAAEAERLRESTKRTETARAASVSVASGAPTSAPLAPTDPSISLRATIRNALAAASA